MSYKTEKIKKLIPMYLKGNLTNAEQKEVENALKEYPELNKELNDFSEIDQYYKDLEEETPTPPKDLYLKIINNIKAQEKQKTLVVKPGILETIQNILRNIFLSPRVAWACAACAILIMLVSVPMNNNIFSTLTDNTTTTKSVIQINIVFNEDAREKEIRELINKVNARIIDGPTPNGLYVLGVTDHGQKETILTTLQTSPSVKFAEIKY